MAFIEHGWQDFTPGKTLVGEFWSRAPAVHIQQGAEEAGSPISSG